MPPSPTVTLVLGRSKGSAEQQTWKRSCSAMRIGFSTREKVRVSTRGQAGPPCPALVPQGAAETEGSPGTLLSPQNPSFKMGEGVLSREPSTLKIEIVGSKDSLSRNAWEGGKLVGRGRKVLHKGDI